MTPQAPERPSDEVSAWVEEWHGDVAPDGSPQDCDGETGEDENLEAVVPPASSRGWGSGWPHCQTDRLATVVAGGGVRLAVRREIAPLVAWLCAQTLDRGYALRKGQCWGFACRAIRGRSVPSNHSWGLAVDLNSLANPMGSRLVTDMPPWMPVLWRDHGFRWGGDYSGRKDAMHFEYVKTLSAASEAVGRLGEPDAVRPAPRPKETSGTAPHDTPAAAPVGTTVPPFPLPQGHYFGVDPTPDSHTGHDPADRVGVRTLQARLVERGWDLGPDGVDGRYGGDTKTVVSRFQEEKRLHVDGRVGPATWATLWQAPITR
jgi:hypothetical protein